MARGRKPRRRKAGRDRTRYLVTGLLVILVGAIVWYAYLLPRAGSGTTGTAEPVILYVNQGNGVVNVTNFGELTSFAIAHGFNTIFFQIARDGVLLFGQQDLRTFVSSARLDNLSIFFALSFDNPSQQIPTSIYGLGENGINLDVLNLSYSSQKSLLASLEAGYGGTTAVTTSNMSSTLKPDMLVLETYGLDFQPYIRHGIVGSVGVFTTTSEAQYESEVQYALKNSDGVMVFDYAGLLKSGYY